jgi:hypothetical protein
MGRIFAVLGGIRDGRDKPTQSQDQMKRAPGCAKLNSLSEFNHKHIALFDKITEHIQPAFGLSGGTAPDLRPYLGTHWPANPIFVPNKGHSG